MVDHRVLNNRSHDLPLKMCCALLCPPMLCTCLTDNTNTKCLTLVEQIACNMTAEEDYQQHRSRQSERWMES